MLLFIGMVMITVQKLPLVECRLGEPASSGFSTSTSSSSSSTTWLQMVFQWITPSSEDDSIQPDEYDNNIMKGSENPETSNGASQYIVRFDQSDRDIPVTRAEIEQRAQQVASYLGGTVLHIYEHVFPGAAIGNVPNTSSFTSASTTPTTDSNNGSSTYRTYNNIPNAPSFSFENDLVIGKRFTASSLSDDLDRNIVKVQDQAPGPLDRINQKQLPLDGTYDYVYDGKGVTVFVVDTGIRATHVELSSISVTCGYTAFPAEGCDDMNGHGTHVAGSIASRTFGVAKKANLVNVKVLDKNGGGTFGTLLAGLDYIIQQKQQNPFTPMVANLSLSGGKSDSLNDAVNAAVQAGIILVVAAGNDDVNACQVSPAGANLPITVGASHQASSTGILAFVSLLFSRRRDRRASFSNFGSCVDIYTWGVQVQSLGISSPTAVVYKTGTSMATPHVTGAAAIYLSRNPNMTAAEVKTVLIQDASTQQLQWLHQKGSPNRILNTQNIV
jgi:aqualysin 1